ncbi:MAG: molybdopterin-binding protein, partial [Spirulinaceae cyanobacterium]
MSAEIICVGTELLLGEILNGNARFLAAELARLGIPHYFQTVVGDNVA